VDTLRNHAVDHFVPPTPVTRTWERVPSIEVPVVVVSGALDSPDHIDAGHRLVHSATDGRAVDIAETAHYPNMERPDEFDDAIAAIVG
jgi:pimeloyl-ACP methyl ester carboxylesterase